MVVARRPRRSERAVLVPREQRHGDERPGDARPETSDPPIPVLHSAGDQRDANRKRRKDGAVLVLPERAIRLGGSGAGVNGDYGAPSGGYGAPAGQSQTPNTGQQTIFQSLFLEK